MSDPTPQIWQSLAHLSIAELRYLPETGSTNADALAWAAQGAPDFSLVIADKQTAGRGRLGRGWITFPGAALAFSLILRDIPNLETIPYYSPWGALAVCEALEALGLQPEIKWPNDVLLERRKVAGLLLESSWQREQIEAAVVGIGVNIAPSAVPPAAELRFPADSVEGILGQPVDRWSLLGAILGSMAAWREKLAAPDFLAAWERRLAFRGEWVLVGDGLSPTRLGRVEGLAPGGQLRLTAEDGLPFSISVGEISLRPA
ncbi:MAG TPA: biotin--[acetyl-CoA-carboxylase] ligase [Anaerolineaceae bacterium]|nr:biotin--[acetyl-CoA-carboxylase] ligase [Anaerolineaceae bacterium]